KIDNMKHQHTNVLEFSSQAPVTPAALAASSGPEKAVGFVAVAAGAGLATLFSDMGADQVIEGGQTMNPSAEDILSAVARVNARQVVVLPNNKNIILAAEQAAKLVEGKEIFVIPTKTIPQGVTCLLDYLDNLDLQDYLTDMNERIKDVHTGQVTYAVRDTVVKDTTISTGDILCLYNGEIVCTGKDIQTASKELLDYMLDKVDSEFISIYYGEETTEDMAQELADHIAANNADVEAETYDGKQPLYYYIISVE
ncbi:MAG: DAK2 domain-containing protein, partial [Defluviitaleaceae bacterium]|nr:DAK2 domain-containing protein [Defluviitaleaceae bacterium]